VPLPEPPTARCAAPAAGPAPSAAGNSATGADAGATRADTGDRPARAALPRLAARAAGAVRAWPVLRQLRGEGGDRWGLADAATSAATRSLRPRTETADAVVGSTCPYCAVGCAQRIFVRDGAVIAVEGDPASPISRGRLCPKGAATKELVTHPQRLDRVRYRRPHGTEWEDLPLEEAMDMIADRALDARARGWQETAESGARLARTMGLGSLGGACLDNEENYLAKKLFTALGVVRVENQARL
jgi:formate dehydrogenase major subunit